LSQIQDIDGKIYNSFDSAGAKIKKDVFRHPFLISLKRIISL